MNALLISLALFFSLVNVESFTNEIKPLAFKGYVTIDLKPCEGASVSICRLTGENGNCQTEIYKLVTGKNGQFDFQLEPSAHYKLTVEKEGFVDRFALFDTEVPTDKTGALTPFQFNVDLSNYPEAKEPVKIASVFFDSVNNKIDYRLDLK